MYERFPGGKEQCFLATYDIVVRRMQMKILGEREQREKLADPADPAGPRRRLRMLAEAFAREVIGYPNAARLVLVEALCGGPEGPPLSERTERTRRLVEQVLTHSLRADPDGRPPPRAMLGAIVQDGTRLVSVRLCEGRIQKLVQELSEVCLAAVPPVW
jgi:AcrR family transcriptional regulator